MSSSLDGLRILVLEDEFLIAMDVEQLCRDHGATDVVIARNIHEASNLRETVSVDAAILDLMLEGVSTLEFAGKLRNEGVPFIFASGYTDFNDVFDAFPGVPLVAKPYSGSDLVNAIASVFQTSRGSGSV